MINPFKAFSKKLLLLGSKQDFSTIPLASVVILDYSQIINPKEDLRKEIERAYGPKGVGLALVKNVPGYEKKRKALLPLAQTLANLPKASLQKLEDKDSLYSVGWSHGREQFQGKYDFSKGSFYANPLCDTPPPNPNGNKS